jgi:integrase
MRLTKKVIDRFKYEGDGSSQDIRWDAQIPGFGVRIYPSGKKSFVLSYRSDGRKHIMTVGRYGVMTLEQARDDAREKLVSVNKGADPLEKRRRESQGETVKILCTQYLERYAKLKKKTWKEDERRIERHLIPAWGLKKVKSIRESDVSHLHFKIGETAPYEANRVLALCSKIFELAKKWGFVPDNFKNPARNIDKYNETSRDRWVEPNELPKLAKAIDEEENEFVRAALWLYLLTGVRKSELLGAKWGDINFDRNELRLEDTKAGRTHHVPLSSPALSLIETIPRLDSNPYLLPGRRKGKHLVNISAPWNRVREKAGTQDVRLHDLRRTVGSWIAQSGNSLHLIGKILNHSNASTTQVYARLTQDNARVALEAHGKQIMGAAGKEPIGEVIKIRPKNKSKKQRKG